MIDHIGLTVTNFEASKQFYKLALTSIDYQLLADIPASVSGTKDYAGFGESPKPDFWISAGSLGASAIHVAFNVKSRAQVDTFYHAAIAAGAKDNGAPGLRTHYHSNYYGAFVLDFDGHNIEAVCHLAE